MSFRILLVEDDTRLSTLIAGYLRKNDYEVDTVLHGDAAVPAILSIRPDLVILDVNLPGKDGFEICREARKQYDGVIIMVTARDEPFDELLGLEIGADDYVHKPVEPRILLARIKAQLRRTPARAADSSAPQPERYTFGKFSIDRTGRTVMLPDGSAPDLTSAEFDLLWALVCHAGEVVSRDDLMLQLRGVEFDGLDRTIDGRISKLRRKLRDDASNPQRIKTIRSKGYQFSKHAWGIDE
ncbi:response regulator [Burkholderia ubonensis]|uniref:XRE family transcriptional regulator n=2 Tax=Burkholderia ubonensis TaxID=101571 RepID=A0AAW3MZ47_9BURK|nr:response regulator [Burkholderia ubonensis]AOK62603.1 XRE family transcriptional regulator [Burkholderia ubonensis]KVD14119.1 XRE family transcriptional regulator [Burkholderia ubonensis]KVD75612.1 XRE family transcriptional regulator [Burkholderia ubonensis]KVN44249.1 XRE family transcriptional regulator [Burkholderia ubonensis]KVP55573.1 XRE family transcriptional regulator [Burkholderia ubonensis]